MAVFPDLTVLPAHELVGPEAERARRELARNIGVVFARAKVSARLWSPSPCPPREVWS